MFPSFFFLTCLILRSHVTSIFAVNFESTTLGFNNLSISLSLCTCRPLNREIRISVADPRLDYIDGYAAQSDYFLRRYSRFQALRISPLCSRARVCACMCERAHCAGICAYIYGIHCVTRRSSQREISVLY